MAEHAGEVYERMGEVLAALSYIKKERSTGVSYEFRSIDAVMNHLHKPLAEAGLFLSPRVLDDWSVNPIPGTNNRTQYQATFRVCIDVYAKDGSLVTLGPGLAQSHDYGDKAVYQAQQNAIKYLLLEAFAIPTAEQDMDAREADPSPAPEPVDLSEMIRTKVAIFSEWSEEERSEEWVAHAKEVLGGKPKTPAEVDKVITSMTEQYYEQHPPGDDEAPF